MKIRKQFSILLAFTALAMLFLSACSKSTDSGIIQHRRGTGVKTEADTDTVQTGEDIAETEEILAESGLYIITKIDTEHKVAAFQKAEGGRQSQYAYTVGTMFLDKYGNTKSVASFLTGDVVEIEVSGRSGQLRSVQLSGDVWVQEDIANYSVDESICAFTIGQTRYTYDSRMDIFSGDTKVSFSSLGKSDVLRAVGIGKKLISLAVTRGHGYLALSNTKLFEGSFICVGDKIFEEVTENMQIEVPEGNYLVTVANNGYGGSREITISREQTTNLNLDELKGEGPKVCRITFDVGVEGAVLRIDGKVADYSQPIEVQYGVHTISVEAEGYDTISEKLVVNSAEAEIEISLTAASGKDSAKSDSSDNSSNANSTNNSNTNAASSTNTDNGSSNNTANTNGGNNSNTDASGGNTNTDGSNNNDSSSTDYLTTLYNLLTSINNTNTSNSNSNSSNSNTGDVYENLGDG